jgi:hypothetical protein
LALAGACTAKTATQTATVSGGGAQSLYMCTRIKILMPARGWSHRRRNLFFLFHPISSISSFVNKSINQWIGFNSFGLPGGAQLVDVSMN